LSTLWQARFDSNADELAQRYTASIHLDQHLAPHDIRYSQAHVEALRQAGVLTADEVTTLHAALEQVGAELEAGELALDPALEDIHTIIENRVTEIAGPTGAKLHTGRSRNDQCVTVMRLFMLDATDDAIASVRRLQAALLEQANQHRQTVVPAYTHMRRAQPIRLAHHLLAYFWMLQRDRQRLEGARTRHAPAPVSRSTATSSPGSSASTASPRTASTPSATATSSSSFSPPPPCAPATSAASPPTSACGRDRSSTSPRSTWPTAPAPA